MSQIDTQEEKALNEEAEEINSRAEPPIAEQQAVEDVEEPKAEVATEVEGTETETTDEEPKKGFQSRVRELNAAKKAAEEKAKSLEEKLAELTNPVGLQGNTPQYNPQEPLIAPGEEIDVAELNRRQSVREASILQQANANAQLLQKQGEAINRINSEASEVIKTYPELDPDSESFDEELSETIAEATEAYVKSQPYTASVKGFVARLMKPYKGAVDKQVGQATENIAKQVSQAALRPTAIRKGEKAPTEKSIEELEQELGIVQA